MEYERGIAKTAAAMNLHRSTLLHRIERIEELAQGLLNHPETRMHILLSFYLEKAEAGLTLFHRNSFHERLAPDIEDRVYSLKEFSSFPCG